MSVLDCFVRSAFARFKNSCKMRSIQPWKNYCYLLQNSVKFFVTVNVKTIKY